MKTSNKRALALGKSKGFTLIELLVVIAIIGILSSVILASLGSARTKGRIASAQQTLKSFSTGLAQCVNDQIGVDIATAPLNSGATYTAATTLACATGGANYYWPVLPLAGQASGAWYYASFTQVKGDSFSFSATGDGKTILCTESTCTTS